MSDTLHYARTARDVSDWLARIGRPQFVAVDTETTGWDPQLDRLVLIQVHAGEEVPTLVVDAGAVDVAALGRLFGDQAVAKVFHHGAFDIRFLDAAGVAVERMADTMLAQQLLDGGEASPGGRGLAAIAAFRLGRTLDKTVRAGFAGGGAVTGEQMRYAAEDARATFDVFDQQRDELVRAGLARVARLEFAALPVLARLQTRGVALDVPRWRALITDLTGRLPELEGAAQRELVTPDSPRDLFGPAPVNLDAPEQVRAALSRVGVEVASTREVVLRDHSSHPAVAALLEYRQVAKLVANWGGDWAERVVHPRSGRVHADWRQIVGAGRIACSDPNLTQVPKDADYRSCFVAGEGRMLVVADYSQQELRILAAVSGDRALAQVFASGADLHLRTAAMAFDVPESNVTAAQRTAAKALNFGLMYGMGAAGFARATGMSLDEARAAMGAYFAAFPAVEAWLVEAETAAKRSGRARTPLGRIRQLPSDAGNPTTLARNAPIQGAGADMTKAALVEVSRRLADRWGHSLGAPGSLGPVLVIHDELVVEVPESEAEDAAALVADSMLAAARDVLGDVPGEVNVSISRTWAGAAEARRFVGPHRPAPLSSNPPV